jgi:hypothetical protein
MNGKCPASCGRYYVIKKPFREFREICGAKYPPPPHCPEHDLREA